MERAEQPARLGSKTHNHTFHKLEAHHSHKVNGLAPGSSRWNTDPCQGTHILSLWRIDMLPSYESMNRF